MKRPLDTPIGRQDAPGEALANSLDGTPRLLVSSREVRAKVEEFRLAWPGLRLFYAVKANPDLSLVACLAGMGIGFELSSLAELSLLRGLGVQASRLISSNTIKTGEFVAAAASSGLRQLAVDSVAEVDKLAELHPGCEAMVRLAVDNSGSAWPLDRKFGVGPEEAVELLLYSREQGLKPHGLVFHVGSQCGSIASWRSALEVARGVWEGAARRGIALSCLNVGGGFPARYPGPVPPPLADILSAIQGEVERLFPSEIEVQAEPGRSLVAEAGVLLSRVVGKAERGGVPWLYLDVGVFNGLAEALGGIRYEIELVGDGRGPVRRWTVAGPSCDSMDVIAEDVELPEPAVGQVVQILSAGAYTSAYASSFNGCPVPSVHLLEG